jgi:hypothetical protein
MSSKQEELEKKINDLKRDQESLKVVVTRIERTEEIKRVIKDQQGGMFKYFADLLKIILAIIVIISGSKIAEQPWVSKLIE